MNKLIKWLKWFDANLIKILISVFIFLIPLYPKFPLKYLEYTVVAIRLDDIFVVVIVAAFFIQLLRRKEHIQQKFLVPFLIFWSAVFLSYLVNAYVTHLIVIPHIGFLHSLRRVEYMLLFFIAAASVKTVKDLYYFSVLIFWTVALVTVYGICQKYIGYPYFPAVQTMNPEFARGHLLYLTPEARVSSTFAGHYDLAAYLVFMMPLLLGFFFRKKNYFYFLIFVLSLYVLVLTASRISFLAYAISIVAYLIFVKRPKWLVVVIIITVAFNLLSNDLTKRFLSTIQFKEIFIGLQKQIVIPQRITTKELPAGSFSIPVKDGKVDEATVKKNDLLLRERIMTDLRNQASLSGKTISNADLAAKADSAAKDYKRKFSIMVDISASTRFQEEWPRAIHAFFKDPALGTGPSSITESTDNDYLRWIGETGAFGALSFLFILFLPVQMIWSKRKLVPTDDRAFYFGYVFGLGALMINASYIDVFEASKVAYQFWLVTGIFVASLTLLTKKELSSQTHAHHP